MAKLTRKTCIPFGLSGSVSNFGQFGSKQAGTPQTSQDPAVIQGLNSWIDGWTTAVVTGNKAAYIEDMNGFCLVSQYMNSYLYQMGIPEWDSATTYFVGSVVQGAAGGASAKQWFISLQDNNLNNAPPASADNAFWQWANRPLPQTFGVGNGVTAGLSIAPNAGSPTYKIDVSASTISVQGVVLSSFAQTANVRTSGLNGLDTGTWTSGTWYALYAVCDATGVATVGTVLSLNGTFPTTMPTGTTQARRIGWIYSDSSTTFTSFQMQGAWWTWNGATQFSQNLPGLNTNMRSAGMSPTSTVASFCIQFGAHTQVYAKVTGSAMPATLVAGMSPQPTVDEQGQTVVQLTTNASQHIDFLYNSYAADLATIITLAYYDPA